jgi:response regulator RpfG family c-di-GMP phosphodiesterase
MSVQTSTNSCKILLVDDEENIVRAIARLLIEDDLEVLTAGSGAEALQVLEAHPDVALILSDQRMPGMSGADLLEKARELTPDAVRMVLTGYADMAATMDAINKGGAWRYLTKPWDDEVLRRSIGEGVALYRLVQENRQLHALVEQQNRELSQWNDGLKGRVLEQTATIRRQNDELKERNRQIVDSFRHTIVAFSKLIELHSNRLQEHTGNVTQLSVKAATDLRLPPEEIETIRTAALLHDIGVIGIAPEILDKQMEAMPPEELKVFLQHAVRGQTALDAVQELRGAGLLIRHHHENYCGAGFPDGIAGEAIPLGSRIIGFADFLDRAARGERGEPAAGSALARAKKELGSRLDPALFAVMEPHVHALYGQGVFAAQNQEKELRPKQLLPGMTVTRNLVSISGIQILAKGTVLDDNKITAVVRHYRVDPPAVGVHVDWSQAAGEAGTELKIGFGAVANKPAERQPEATRGSRSSASGERELTPKQLLEGMCITRNLYSGTGLLLLTAGSVLDAGSIVAVARYYEIDPPRDGIFVTPPKKAAP